MEEVAAGFADYASRREARAVPARPGPLAALGRGAGFLGAAGLRRVVGGPRCRHAPHARMLPARRRRRAAAAAADVARRPAVGRRLARGLAAVEDPAAVAARLRAHGPAEPAPPAGAEARATPVVVEAAKRALPAGLGEARSGGERLLDLLDAVPLHHLPPARDLGAHVGGEALRRAAFGPRAEVAQARLHAGSASASPNSALSRRTAGSGVPAGAM
jgi:hypothetical protein